MFPIKDCKCLLKSVNLNVIFWGNKVIDGQYGDVLLLYYLAVMVWSNTIHLFNVRLLQTGCRRLKSYIAPCWPIFDPNQGFFQVGLGLVTNLGHVQSQNGVHRFATVSGLSNMFP